MWNERTNKITTKRPKWKHMAKRRNSLAAFSTENSRMNSSRLCLRDSSAKRKPTVGRKKIAACGHNESGINISVVFNIGNAGRERERYRRHYDVTRSIVTWRVYERRTHLYVSSISTVRGKTAVVWSKIKINCCPWANRSNLAYAYTAYSMISQTRFTALWLISWTTRYRIFLRILTENCGCSILSG